MDAGHHRAGHRRAPGPDAWRPVIYLETLAVRILTLEKKIIPPGVEKSLITETYNEVITG
jgi:hypothetical protein